MGVPLKNEVILKVIVIVVVEYLSEILVVWIFIEVERVAVLHVFFENLWDVATQGVQINFKSFLSLYLSWFVFKIHPGQFTFVCKVYKHITDRF